MLRSRFLWKLYAGYALLIVLTAIIVGTLVASSVTRDATAKIDRELHGDAVLLREMMVMDPPRQASSDLNDRIARIARATESRLTVIRNDGLVTADSDVDPSGLDNHNQRPEIVEARRDEIGSAERRSRTLGKRMRYVAVAVRETDGGEIQGFARAAMSADSRDERLAAIKRLVALGAALATFAALALAFGVAQRVTRPLRSMTVAAKALADGDYDRRIVAADRGDELGSLADAFNVMRERLHTQLETATLERSRLEAILASMVEGVVAVDNKERIVHVNQVASDLLGVVAKNAIGRPIWEVTRLAAVTQTLKRALETQAPAEEELQLTGRDARQIELRATPLEDGESELHGAVLVLDDRTTVRRLETVRQDFVANVSHELKTPVTAIRGLAETLIDDPDMPEETERAFLGRIREQSVRLSTLVTDLLSLSRLDSIGSSDTEIVDARQAVRSGVRALMSASEAKGIKVDLRLPEVQVRVRGEHRALEEVVSNLVDNAIKYSPDGATVSVIMRANQDDVEIEVTDHGMGIPASHLGRIFERFYRVDSARSREIEGTGLGLAIVKHIVRSMEGDIGVASKPGEGTTFTMSLPRHRGGGGC